MPMSAVPAGVSSAGDPLTRPAGKRYAAVRDRRRPAGRMYERGRRMPPTGPGDDRWRPDVPPAPSRRSAMRRLSTPLVLTAVLASLALAAPAGADTTPTPVSSAPQPVTGPGGALTAAAGVLDTAAPALRPVSYRRNVLRLAVSEPGRLEIHY